MPVKESFFLCNKDMKPASALLRFCSVSLYHTTDWENMQPFQRLPVSFEGGPRDQICRRSTQRLPQQHIYITNVQK